tara:strand:- start:245 stop:526 length:282 start_codon:yes stop_codon:yes gene_type:complete
MNAKDKQDLELVHYRLDELDKKIDEIKANQFRSHSKTDENLRFIKENLFNPNEGLWAETKLNSQFRENTTKWRGVIGIGFIGLIIDKVWNMFS